MGGWVISQLGWVEIGVAGVETELGLVTAVGMVGCGGCDGFSNLWVSFSNFFGFEIYRFVSRFSNLWVSFLNFYGFEIYGFVSGFDVCMEDLIFHVMFWVC